MKTSQIAAWLIYGVCAFQIALVVGAPWGAFTQGGATPGRLDVGGRLIAGFSAFLLYGMAQSLLAQDNLGAFKDKTHRFKRRAGWATTSYLVLGIIANLATPSLGEKLIWAPTSTIIFVLALMTMLRTRKRI